MILDASLQFTGFPAVGGIVVAGTNYDMPTAAAQPSSNVVDLHMAGLPVLPAGSGARDLGVGDDPALKLLVLVTLSLTGGVSLQVEFQGAPDDGTGAPGAYVPWWDSPVYTTAGSMLLTGARLCDMDFPRPPSGVPEPRFVRFLWTSVGPHTGGRLGAWIVLDRHDQFYNGAFNYIHGGYRPGVIVTN